MMKWALPMPTQIPAAVPAAGALAPSLEPRSGEAKTLHLKVIAHGEEDLPSESELTARSELVGQWRARCGRVRTHGEHPFGRMVNQAMDDLGSFALLEGEP